MIELILGSQSPRRKEILNFFSLPFKTVTSDFDEETVPFQGNPADYVNQIALGKARALVPRFPNTPILTADTWKAQRCRRCFLRALRTCR